MTGPDVMLIGAAAVALGVQESTLRRLIDNGTLVVPRAGRYRLFEADRLDEYRGVLETGGYLPPADPLADFPAVTG